MGGEGRGEERRGGGTRGEERRGNEGRRGRGEGRGEEGEGRGTVHGAIQYLTGLMYILYILGLLSMEGPRNSDKCKHRLVASVNC